MYMYTAIALVCREKERAMMQAGAPLIQPQNTEKPRFTGGGFNLKQPTQTTQA